MIDVEFVKTPKAPPAVSLAPSAPPGEPLSSEEITKETYDAMGWGTPPPRPVVPASLAPAAPAPTPTPAPAPAPTPTPAPAPFAMDATALIKETAREVGSAVAKAMAPARPAVAATPLTATIELVEDDAEDLKAAQYLEQSERRYAGVAKKLLDWLTALYAYETQWSAANENKPFEADDAAHDVWYDANPCPVDRKTLDEAKISMRAEEIYERKAAPQIRKMNSEQAWREKAPEVYLVANTKIIEMVRAVSPEMAALLCDTDGTPNLSAENAKKAEDYDAVAYEVLNVSAQRLWNLIVLLEQTVLEGMDVKLSRNRAIDMGIISAQEEEEQRILQTPAEQTRNGKQFATIAQWSNMSAEQQASHWTLTVDDMEALLVKTFAVQAKKSIEHIDGVAKKKYAKPNPTVAARPTATPAPTAQPQAQARKHQSPSISSPSDAVPQTVNPPAPAKTYGEQAVAEHFS